MYKIASKEKGIASSTIDFPRTGVELSTDNWPHTWPHLQLEAFAVRVIDRNYQLHWKYTVYGTGRSGASRWIRLHATPIVVTRPSLDRKKRIPSRAWNSRTPPRVTMHTLNKKRLLVRLPPYLYIFSKFFAFFAFPFLLNELCNYSSVIFFF